MMRPEPVVMRPEPVEGPGVRTSTSSARKRVGGFDRLTRITSRLPDQSTACRPPGHAVRPRGRGRGLGRMVSLASARPWPGSGRSGSAVPASARPIRAPVEARPPRRHPCLDRPVPRRSPGVSSSPRCSRARCWRSRLSSACATVRRAGTYQALVGQAEQACLDCPLIARCLYAAVVEHDVAGYVGGTTPAERSRIRRALRITVRPGGLRHPGRGDRSATGRSTTTRSFGCATPTPTRAWRPWPAGSAAPCPR